MTVIRALIHQSVTSILWIYSLIREGFIRETLSRPKSHKKFFLDRASQLWLCTKNSAMKNFWKIPKKEEFCEINFHKYRIFSF